MAYNNGKVRARQVVTQSQQTNDLGIVANVPMGEWNANTQYLKLNIVRSHGASYMAKKQNQGIEPTITTGWQEVWQVVAYDGNAVNPTGTYPDMTVGNATQAQNDGSGKDISQQFSSLISDIEGIQQDITNEAHFRGYLATNAEVQALSGTPNDYAYSAESGTVWIYQTATGWTNSGKVVPDQTTPASTTIPLMDGTGNAGSSEEYARGDHRHPTDTTRASTAVATQSSNGLMSAADKVKLDGLSGSGGGSYSLATVTFPIGEGEPGTPDGMGTNGILIVLRYVIPKRSAGTYTYPSLLNAIQNENNFIVQKTPHSVSIGGSLFGSGNAAASANFIALMLKITDVSNSYFTMSYPDTGSHDVTINSVNIPLPASWPNLVKIFVEDV